jgi:hypothetical protein
MFFPGVNQLKPPRPLVAIQKHALQFLYARCRRVEALLGDFNSSPEVRDIESWSGNPADDLALAMWLRQEDGSLPQQALVSGWQFIDVQLLSLPGVGEGAQVELMSVLPPPLREIYSEPSNVLVSPPPTSLQIEAVNCAFGVRPKDYPALIEKLVAVGIVELHSEPPACINGVFAVPKDESAQRLIIDARRANLFFVEPQKVDLPSPTLFADLILVPGSRLYVGKSDIRNMYHRFRIPAWMETYFGLPPVTMKGFGEAKQYPVVVSLAMGFSHAVLLAHATNEAIVAEDANALGFPLLHGRGPHHIGSGSVVYIDDIIVLATDKETASGFKRRVDKDLAGKGFVVHEGKSVLPGTEDPVDCLGVALSSDGWVSPAPKRLRKIEQASIAVLQKKVASPKALSRLIGAWVWLLLLNRPLLSILSASTYEFILLPEQELVLQLPLEVMEDLTLLLGVVPLLLVDLAIPFASLAFATDASESGGGVVSSAISTDQVQKLFPARHVRGWYESPADSVDLQVAPKVHDFFQENQDWTVVVSTKWKFADWINRLEAHALLLALKHISMNKSLWNTRICFFVDNTAVLGSVAKGRSSSTRLNVICRRIAALVCTSGIRPLWFWVPSELNPADGPSRQPL